MFAAMRTGSNFLEASLNAFPGITSYGEVFNPGFMGKLNQDTLLDTTLAERDADPLAFLERMRLQTEGMPGFRLFHDHDPRVIAAVLDDPTCAKIVLTRNPLDSYVSLLIARETGQWRLTNIRALRSAKVRFDPAEFVRHLDGLAEFYDHVQRRLQVTGQAAFHIDYDDLQDVEVLNGLAGFLGIEGRLEAVDDKLKKQNPEPIWQKLENPEAVEEALARIDRFSLSKVPTFEPRRGAVATTYIAGREAPLLFMPMRGGPEAQVTAWLDQVSRGVLAEADRRTLRDWGRGQPGWQAFTVLRHPLVRAHALFEREVLTREMPEVVGVLKRVYGMQMPRRRNTAEDYRTAFLCFLRFLKAYLGGQTNLKVSARLASQAALIEGFARFRSPDLILREDDLAEGLAFLGRRHGLPQADLPPAGDPPLFALEEIVDDTVKAAARDAYARDYDLFGFD
ncbi:nodulation protein NodH [Falsirhodobacter algicola]|uniref:Nodulation protein NodH n=1 Tax=Falsirhodobacter algicola TaxID=2692330 RepID=A0A8J8MT75_9RHOB|nr:nodulation protein NodH [Falsirhodobacter algicola]QUS36037.1 nodulation protein NodH [Falsirhodobacter algicola]